MSLKIFAFCHDHGLSSSNGIKFLLAPIPSLISNPTAFLWHFWVHIHHFKEFIVPLSSTTIWSQPLKPISLLEVWLSHLPPACLGDCAQASPSCGPHSSWGDSDNAEKHQPSGGRYLLASFIYQTHGLLARMPAGLAMTRVGAQGRPKPVSLKINSVVCSLRRSFWSQC